MGGGELSGLNREVGEFSGGGAVPWVKPRYSTDISSRTSFHDQGAGKSMDFMENRKGAYGVGRELKST